MKKQADKDEDETGSLMPLFSSESKASRLRLLGFLASKKHRTICCGDEALCSHQPDLTPQPSLTQQTHDKHSCVASRQGGKSHGWNTEAGNSCLDRILESIVIT